MIKKLSGVADEPEGCAATERDLDRLDREESHEVQHREMQSPASWDKPLHQYRLGANWPESCSAEKTLVLVDKQLSMSWQCIVVVKKASSILGCFRKRVAHGWREVIPACCR